MKDFILQMARKNIGSLCIFLKNPSNSEYLDFLNACIPAAALKRSLPERIFYLDREQIDPLLCACGKHLSFIGFKSGYRTSCGDKSCYVRKRKETCLEKYGVDNPKKSKDVIEKEKEGILERWGGQHYMRNEEVREKYSIAMQEKWGVEWPQQSKEISEKSKSTYRKNPKKDEIIKKRSDAIKSKSPEEKEEISRRKKETVEKNWGGSDNLYKHIREKIKEASMDRLGVSHHLSHPDIIKKRVERYKENVTNKIKLRLPSTVKYVDRQPNANKSDNIISLECLECNSVFDINRQYLVSREKIGSEICVNCNPRLSGTSFMEKDLLRFIKESYAGEIIESDKKTLSGREIDIFLPDANLAFEFNGLYWHSELHKGKNYHRDKTKDCLNLGINLMHIWEDDWRHKSEIVKSIILNKLGSSKKIYARSCEIKEVGNSEARLFLNENHIQGFVGSKHKIGLYSKGELVALMTLGSLRKPLGQKPEDGAYELLRFCNKNGISVVGGASRLFGHFLKARNPKSVISYSDNSRGVGNLYEKLGFGFAHETIPNYYYVVNERRAHRFNFRKDKLIKDGADPSKTEVQIMSEGGFYRIFDCGSKKWKFLA